MELKKDTSCLHFEKIILTAFAWRIDSKGAWWKLREEGRAISSSVGGL